MPKTKKSKGTGTPHVKPPSFGLLVCVTVLVLSCFLLNDFFLFQPCDQEEGETNVIQSLVWTSRDGWLMFTLGRLLTAVITFVIFCVLVACCLGCCGFKVPKEQQLPT